MSWQDRLREAAYTSPSGRRMVFKYEDVSRSFDKQTAAFNFPAVGGTYIQDLGKTGYKYPLRLIFWGDDHDTEATAFESLLAETGQGKLEHPAYGLVNVVPFGTIERRDDLKTAANQTIIETAFWETILVLFPSSQVDPSKAVSDSISDFNAAAASQFSKQSSITTALERVGLRNKMRRVLESTRSAMFAVTAPRNEIVREFTGAFDSLNRTLDIFASDPLGAGGLESIFAQSLLFMQTPAKSARTGAGLRSLGNEQFTAYNDLVTGFIADGVYEANGTTGPENDFTTDDLFVLGSIGGVVSTVLNSQFQTKPQALAAAASVLDLVADAVAWRDSVFYELQMIDTGEAYQQFLNMTSLLAGFLVQISFTLRQEYTFILDRERTIIDLVAELYGAVDEFLDFFIITNNLSGSEILELPRGRRIVYYV
jgi:hypothetical protein